MANGKIPNINNKFYGEKLVEVTFPDSTSSLGFDEYNAVLNNVNSSVSSSIIMDADYALNARIPTNNDRLLSGTAQRMEIQDSNYSSVAWTSPRYVGSQTISARYNDYTPSGSSVTFADGTVGPWKGDQVFDEYPGDETFTRGNPLGKVPAIDLYSTHFVLFDRINIDDALFDRDVFHCLYLIDDQGNKQPLTYKNKNLVDLRRLYVQGSNAEVVFLGQNNQELLDDYPIGRVGIVSRQGSIITHEQYLGDNAGNDIFSSPYAPDPINLYTQGIPPALSKWVFSFNDQGKYGNSSQVGNNCFAGIGFVPSLFSSSYEGNETYKLTYSLSGSGYDRTYYLDENADFFGFNSFIKQNTGKSKNTDNFTTKKAVENYGTINPIRQFSLRINHYRGLQQLYRWDGSTALNGSYPNGFDTGTFLDINGDYFVEGKYINNPNAFSPISYSLNENSLDPFYILTYNQDNNKVFEGTIYETIINDAGFQSTSPFLGPTSYETNLSAIQCPDYTSGTNIVTLNRLPMEPQSSRGGSVPLSIGDDINFLTTPLSNSFPTSLVNNTGDNISELVSEFFRPQIIAETKVTEISIGEIDQEYLCSYSLFLNTANGYRLTWVSDYAYANNTPEISCDDIDGAAIPSADNASMGHYSLGPGDVQAVCSGFQSNWSLIGSGQQYEGSQRSAQIQPDQIHMLYFNTASTQYMGGEEGVAGGNYPASFDGGNTTDKSSFFNTLSHGDIIELTQWEDKYDSLILNTSIGEGKVWRYLILRAPDYYDGSGTPSTQPYDGSSNEARNFSRAYYRFHVQYINGHDADTLNHGSVDPSTPGWPTYQSKFLSGNPDPSTITDNPRIVVHRILRMQDPYIKVKQISGGDLSSPNGIINQPTTVMGTTDIKEHEQYIESQFLTGTGVGVLLPDNYDPKLREQLPDIINKTGIDINSLVQTQISSSN
jgi:hypothetical protein